MLVRSDKKKKWLVVRVQFTSCEIEDYDFFFQLGASGVEEEENQFKIYFPDTDASSGLVHKIEYFLKSENRLQITNPVIHTETIIEQDWNQDWKKNYLPIPISDRILIKPTWLEAPKTEYDVVVEIDPAMAFGTGTHATTRMCLKALEDQIHGGEILLDVGTGTGILSFTALKLGARRAVALDTDVIAVETAQENAAVNNVLSSIELFAGSVDALKPDSFDLLVANVNTLVVVTLLSKIPALLAAHGRAILSGILQSDARVIEDHLKIGNWNFQKSQMEEWLCYIIRQSQV
ncbi:50S ribosomal protein L11 methyltransferase [candidate division KSB1 bacterium]|nr:50S ribosomal protein L11 methyltransferase [candidate division KSB1 bacterium]